MAQEEIQSVVETASRFALVRSEDEEAMRTYLETGHIPFDWFQKQMASLSLGPEKDFKYVDWQGKVTEVRDGILISIAEFPKEDSHEGRI